MVDASDPCASRGGRLLTVASVGASSAEIVGLGVQGYGVFRVYLGVSENRGP